MIPNKVLKTYTRRGAKRARLRPPFSGDAFTAHPCKLSRSHDPLCSSDAGHSSSWRDWESLWCGPAGLIGERVRFRDVADYVRFRAVCSTWRRCSDEPEDALDRRFHPRQWIMLVDEDDGTRRRFLNISTGECIRTELPELAVLAPTSEGLLVLLDEDTDAVSLLNPLTGLRTDLPPITALLTESYYRKVYPDPKTAILRVCGAGLTADSTVAVNFRALHVIAVARPGDEHWTKVAFPPNTAIHGPLLSFAGRVYCATVYDRVIFALETPVHEPPRLVKAVETKTGTSPYQNDTVHLVDNGGELMVLHRMRRPRGPEHRSVGYRMIYRVFRVDLDAGKATRVYSLGGRSAFIGSRRALSVPAGVFPSVSGDSVYVGSDCDEKHGWFIREAMDAYRILDGRVEPNYNAGKAQVHPGSIVECLSSHVADKDDDDY